MVEDDGDDSLKDALDEREDATYGFTNEEKLAWTMYGANRGRERMTIATTRDRPRGGASSASSLNSSSSSPSSYPASSPFTHLNHNGNAANMVDVGNKVPTLRIATARSYVVFPPEVMSAFRVVVDGGGGGGRDDGGGEGGGGGMTTDMIGPKGPIFEIAKIAGIMGAK